MFIFFILKKTGFVKIEEKDVNGRKMIFMKEQGHKFLSEFDRIKEFSDSFGL